MALTKLPKNAFGTGSVDSDKIEDGTIQNVELSGSLANDRLVNSTITFNGTSTALGGSVSITPFVEWQSVITADGSTTTTAVAGNGYFIDTTSNSHTFNLPASASIGDTIAIKDYAGTFASNNLTIGRNGHNIQGAANDSLISTNRASLVLVYVDSTKGWLFTDEHNVSDLQDIRYVTATGGTVTTSGDYKIHSFTGDGCFVVSCGGNPVGSDSVDYLVVAGGGGGGSNEAGGGGAGGFRESHSTCVSGPYTASPLATPTAIPVSTTTYPITVGGGGAGGPPGGGCGTSGSNSVFSTITSSGGGAGGYSFPANPGGSGAGGRSAYPNGTPNSGGTGNTPPVSPPQGNNGGGGGFVPNVTTLGGGGGGASAAGTTAPPGGPAGPGGNGVASSITGSAKGYSGGGGGGTNAVRTAGTGGTIPSASPTASGGNGSNSPSPAGAGTANNGGGGGGGGVLGGGSVGGAGGKGIVIIRYKFQ